MKLILANNQSDEFVTFYGELAKQSAVSFDYAGYTSLLFVFDSKAAQKVQVWNVTNNTSLHRYDSVYINGYLRTYELAATVAICCDALGVAFQNQELSNPPSLSKLTMYAKLAAAGVSIPHTVAGSKQALLQVAAHDTALAFPAVLKRADADRGIDNYKVQHMDDVVALLADHDDQSIWILQEYVANTGYYLVTFYDGEPAFCIYRTMLDAPENRDPRRAHMYKPKGGANATLIPLPEAHPELVAECQKAVLAMNRQIGSVDCLYDETTKQTSVLEVNYNPQFVTIQTFKDTRVQAFLRYLEKEADHDKTKEQA